MNVELNPEIEEMVMRAVQRGAYRSVSEYLDRAVRILHQEEELLALDGATIDEEISLGISQLDAGEGIPGGEARARLQARKAKFIQNSRTQ